MSAEPLIRTPRTAGIWAKLASVTDNRGLSKLIRNYLDEHTKLKPPVGIDGRPNHVPFASGIWAFGHVAHQLSRQGLDVARAQPSATLPLLEEWWKTDRDDSAVKAHHVTASFDPRVSAAMLEAGYPVDAMLLSAVHETLSGYASRFYPGQTLGYIVGCHHDTEVPHCHALIHPTTDAGELIRFSGNKESEAVHEDKFDFLRERFHSVAKRLAVSFMREVAPGAREHTSLAHWLLLCVNAMLAVGPTSVDAAHAAARLVRSARGKPDLAGKLDGTRLDLEGACTPMNADRPDPAAVRGRWSQVHEEFRTDCERHATTARDTLRVFQDVPASVTYTPKFTPGLPPEPCGQKDYLQLARASSNEPVADHWAAHDARLRWSQEQKLREQEALKAYRSSVARISEQQDAMMVRAGYGVALMHVKMAGTLGTVPAFLTTAKLSPPGRAAADLPSMETIEALAERRMQVAVHDQALSHAPADPTATPSLLAKEHVPRFRKLRRPIEPSSGLLPTIGR